MVKKLLLVFTLLIHVLSASSQCVEASEKKILLVGDSWAFFMNTDGTFNDVLEHWGFSNMEYFTNLTLAYTGARTEDFLVEARLVEIENQLLANPSISVVHISLTGNDFLGEWTVDFTPEETLALSDETLGELTTLTDFVKSVRPDIRIVFSGYMYANFAEVIDDAAPFETSHPFYANWESMGFPTFEQLNTVLNDFSDRVYDLSLLDPQIDFINAPALMQYHYGQTAPLGVDPGGTYAAFTQQLPYGDATYPSPKVAMRDYGITRDCFHLSADGYFTMIDYQFQKLYHKLLMDDAYFLAESISENGSVSSTGAISSELKLGETAGEQFTTILTFNTPLMADTLLESASIFLRRENLIGGNPIGTTLTVRMKSGNLGSSINVDASDFSDEGDIMDEACVFGVSAENTDWIRIDLPEAFLALITNADITQFSILAVDASGEQIVFSAGADPEFAPVLNLKYKSSFVGLDEIVKENQLDFLLYPNPAQDQLNIVNFNGEISSVELIDLQGKILKTYSGNVHTITLDDLSTGNYFVRVYTADNAVVKQFYKK